MEQSSSSFLPKILTAGTFVLILLYYLRLPQGPQVLLASDELLANPGFESASGTVPQDWSNVEGTLAITSTVVHSGSYSAAFESNSATTKWFYQVVRITAGSYYTLTGYALKNDVNVDRVMLSMKWFGSPDGTGQSIREDLSLPLYANSPTFTLLTVGGVLAPVGAGSVSVRAVLVPSSDAAARIYVDNLSLTAGTTDLTPTSTSSPSSTPTASPSSTPSPSATPTTSPTASPTPEPPGVLVGRITLQGRGAAPNLSWAVPITVALYAPVATTPTYLYFPATDTSGRFTVTGIITGVYDIAIKKPHALRKRQAGISIGECEAYAVGLPCPSITLGALLEGDANEDGMINGLDYAPLTTAYLKSRGEIGFDERVDFNQDDSIDYSDFALLAANYFEIGD